jgi:hypothetical protein
MLTGMDVTSLLEAWCGGEGSTGTQDSKNIAFGEAFKTKWPCRWLKVEDYVTFRAYCHADAMVNNQT